jgi:hypothetical protein
MLKNKQGATPAIAIIVLVILGFLIFIFAAFIIRNIDVRDDIIQDDSRIIGNENVQELNYSTNESIPADSPEVLNQKIKENKIEIIE